MRVMNLSRNLIYHDTSALIKRCDMKHITRSTLSLFMPGVNCVFLYEV